jgi:hypothetical protein
MVQQMPGSLSCSAEAMKLQAIKTESERGLRTISDRCPSISESLDLKILEAIKTQN